MLFLKLALPASLLYGWLSLSLPAEANPGARALGPTLSTSFGGTDASEPWDATEQAMNTALADANASSDQGLDLSTLPIVKDFLDESGNFKLPVDLPFTLNVTDSFGDYAVGIRTDF